MASSSSSSSKLSVPAASSSQGSSLPKFPPPIHRYSVVTLNVWNTMFWETRGEVLRDWMGKVQPDILCVQECRPEVLETLLDASQWHLCTGCSVRDGAVPAGQGGPQSETPPAKRQRASKEAAPPNKAAARTADIDCEAMFAEPKEQMRVLTAKVSEGALERGWLYEGQILWKHAKFRMLDYGAIDVGIEETHRRLFWAKLQPRSGAEFECMPFIVTTAHLTWQGSAADMTGLLEMSSVPAPAALDPRKAQMGRIVPHLRHWLVDEDLPVLFCGDLNCGFGPKAVLRNQLPVMQDCFSGLELRLEPTHPARPACAEEDMNPDQTLDWIFYDSSSFRPVAASVLKKMYKGELRHVSDHFPVQMVFEMKEPLRSLRRRLVPAGFVSDPFFQIFNHMNREKEEDGANM